MAVSNKITKSELVAKTRACKASSKAKAEARHALRRAAASSSTSATSTPPSPVLFIGPRLGFPKIANMVYINRNIGRWPMRMMVYPSGEVVEFTNRMGQGLPLIPPIDPSTERACVEGLQISMAHVMAQHNLFGGDHFQLTHAPS